jgi:hypothetical protein
VPTTHAYIEIDLRMKQKAIAAATALPVLKTGSFPTDRLLTWLAALGKPPRYVQRDSLRTSPTPVYQRLDS